MAIILTRMKIFDTFAAAHVVTDDGLAFRTDEFIEQLYFTWLRQGSPQYARVSSAGVVAGNEPPELET